MKRTGTRFAGFLFVLLLVFSLLPLSALGAEQRMFDDAGLLTQEQISTLEQNIQNVREEISMDLVVVTTNDTQGKTTRSYADDFYHDGGFGVGGDKSGALLLIDMDNRQAYISTTGAAIDYLDQYRIEKLLDVITEGLKAQDYAGAAQAFLEDTEGFIHAGLPDNAHRYDETTGKVQKVRTFPSWKSILIFLAISIGVGALCAGGVAAKYKFGYKASTYPVRENSNVRMRNRQDIFLSRHITTRVIQDDNDHHSGGSSRGGGSPTHTSSSGTTHGGGGRGF